MVKNVASDRGYVDKLQLVPKGQKERRYLTHAQVALLASKARAGWRRVLVYTLAYTGLRWGEAAALRMRDVDYGKRHLRISKNSVQLGGAGTDETTTKSGKTRVVPFPKKLTPLLKALTAGRRSDGRVFGDDPEKPIRQPYPRDGWFALAVKKSHDDDEGFPLGLTPHDLRHTAASLMISSGANVLVVQRCLGHESAQMTLDTYADLFTDDLDAVAEALDGRLIV
nr:site-specific integrase [Pseudoclavibacter sp. 13-3]